MKKLREDIGFPYDRNTLWVIRETEACLGLKNKDINKITCTELVKYIEQIILISLKKKA